MTEKPGKLNLYLQSTLALIVAGCCLTSCALTPEQKKQQRTEVLTKYCTSVTKHLLDRDPTTIQESVNLLLHQEVSSSARDKLQAQKVLPDSTIDVLRDISDAEVLHRTNSIEVTAVKAITPVDKDTVTFQVTGKETVKVSGKVSEVRPFSMQVTCLLTNDMDIYPLLKDLKGFPQAMIRRPSTQAEQSSSAKRRRRG
jgi:hypothetical protein